MRLLRLTAALVLTVAPAAALQAQVTGVMAPPRSPRNASYSIDATLDPASKTITGSEVVTWRNITAKPPTIFSSISTGTPGATTNRRGNASGSSVSSRTSGRCGRKTAPASRSRRSGSLVKRAVDLTGQMLHRARWQRGRSHGAAGAAFAAGAPGSYADDRGQVDGARPRTVARTGALGNFFFLAQWFPDSACCGAGTAIVPPNTGFSPTGVYDVRLTVPRGWPVGATGVARDRRGGMVRQPIASTRKTCDFAGRRAPTTSSVRRGSSTPRCRRSKCACSCSRNIRTRPTATSTRRARRSSATASGSAPIHPGTSPSSIRRAATAPAAWNTHAVHRRHELAGAAT